VDVVGSKRKRVLISSDFKSAFRRKHIYDVFQELNRIAWPQTAASQHILPKVLKELGNRYEVCFKPKPKGAKGDKDKK
jgi:hypothetical protein